MTVVDVRPLSGPLACRISSVPGSKSIANRALVCAALANGTSTLHALAPGDDTAAMLECIERLGAGVGTDADRATIIGTGGVLRPGPIALDTRLAGTTSRFVTALAALGPGPYRVDGSAPLRARPMADLHTALVALGARLEHGEHDGCLPVTIRGPKRRGGWVAG